MPRRTRTRWTAAEENSPVVSDARAKMSGASGLPGDAPYPQDFSRVFVALSGGPYQVGDGLPPVAESGVGISPVVVGDCKAGVYRNSPVEIRDGPPVVAEPVTGVPPVVISHCKAGVQADGPVEIRDGPPVVAEPVVRITPVVVGCREAGVEGDGAIEVVDGLPVKPEPGVALPAVVVSRRIIGIEPDGFAVGLDRLTAVARHVEGVSPFEPFQGSQRSDILLICRQGRLLFFILGQRQLLFQLVVLSQQGPHVSPHFFQLRGPFTVFPELVDRLYHVIGVCRHLRLQVVDATVPFFADYLGAHYAGGEGGHLILRHLKVFHHGIAFKVGAELFEEQPFYFPEGDGPARYLAVVITGLVGILLHEGAFFSEDRAGQDEALQKHE